MMAMSNEKIKRRRPYYANSWYPAQMEILKPQIRAMINSHEDKNYFPKTKGILCPNLSFSECGLLQSLGFRHIYHHYIDCKLKIFIIGPLHFISSPKLFLTRMDQFETPLGNLRVDKFVVNELMRTGKFQYVDLDTEEEEYSIQILLPFISYGMDLSLVTIVPILVGNYEQQDTQMYAHCFQTFFKREECIFIFSSDLTSYGKQLSEKYKINKIEDTSILDSYDRDILKLIKAKDLTQLKNFLDQKEVNVRGRFVIKILLKILERTGYSIDFIDSSRNCKVKESSGLSVGYATGIIHD